MALAANDEPSNPSRNFEILMFLNNLDRLKSLYPSKIDEQGKKWYWAVDDKLSRGRVETVWRWIEFHLKLLKLVLWGWGW